MWQFRSYFWFNSTHFDCIWVQRIVTIELCSMFKMLNAWWPNVEMLKCSRKERVARSTMMWHKNSEKPCEWKNDMVFTLFLLLFLLFFLFFSASLSLFMGFHSDKHLHTNFIWTTFELEPHCIILWVVSELG